MRAKTVEAQEPQHVLADSLPRIADEAHPARAQIGEPADIVEDAPVLVEIERVHGEVAALCVLFPVLGEDHARVPAGGLDVAPERGDLEMARRDDGGDGAVRQPRGHDGNAGCREPPHHLVGRKPRRDVDVEHRPAEQRVAHRPAGKARSAASQRRQHSARRRLRHPRQHLDHGGWGFALMHRPAELSSCEILRLGRGPGAGEATVSLGANAVIILAPMKM